MRLDIECGDYAERVSATKIQREFRKHYTPPQGPHDPDDDYVQQPGEGEGIEY